MVVGSLSRIADVFFILTTVLLLNMLIAMMAQSYDATLGDEHAKYHLRFARTVLEFRRLPPTPPPLYILSLPYEVCALIHRLYQLTSSTALELMGQEREADATRPSDVRLSSEEAGQADGVVARNTQLMVEYYNRRKFRLAEDEGVELTVELNQKLTRLERLVEREATPRSRVLSSSPFGSMADVASAGLEQE